MFGLEKEKEKDRIKFDFDLEQDLKGHPQKQKDLLSFSKERIASLKELLKEANKEQDFEQLGILLHAFTAFERVIKKIDTSPQRSK